MKQEANEQYHRLLERQLRKYADPALLSNPAFLHFIEAVNDSYRSFEKDKELSDHAFRLSEEEFSETNMQLTSEMELRKRSVQKLKEMLEGISGIQLEETQVADDPLLIVDLLNKEVQKRKIAEEQMLAAKELAEKASLAKSEFLSVVSHEIRTPLNAVIGMGHLLLKHDPRPDQFKNLLALKSSADNLLVLVNDILDFNKIEAGKLELEMDGFNVKRMVADVCTAHLANAAERENTLNWTIDDGIPDCLSGDATRLGQVLNNLISNAVKFTSRGNIDVTVTKVSGDDAANKVFFSVRDTGIGIPDEMLAGIFQPFTQGSSSITRRFGGTGLGLSISSRILELMNSRLNVTSKPAMGSDFYFLLSMPVASTKNVSPDILAHADDALLNKRILLVEDTPFNVLFATQLLNGWNARVDVAENGAVAVDMLQKNSYDLVLMDLQMPVMDGYTATRKLREFNTHTPVIALTASATSNVKDRAKEAGMQDYISKPFNPEDFLARLKKFI